MTSLVQQLINIDHVIRAIEACPPEMINLNTFAYDRTTGGHARPEDVQARKPGVCFCIGGLVASDPFFAAQGVQCAEGCVPYMKGPDGQAWCGQAGALLFGDSAMFCSSGYGFGEGVHKEQALKRLHNRRTQVLAAINEQHLAASDEVVKSTSEQPTKTNIVRRAGRYVMSF